MISVQGLTKKYDEFCAVDNISFEVNKGEIVGFLGPNGAGKTTTMRMITCFLKPTAGEIRVGDFSVAENPLDVKGLIGYLPESAPLYNEMLVLDYLIYVAKIRGIESLDHINRIAYRCGLYSVMHKNISQLSKGYKQRVGLAQAMLHNPEILILDEPTSGLDPNQIVEIRNLIKELGREKTVILSTHILSEVEATCGRVLIINKGKLVADSKTSELRSLSNNSQVVQVKLNSQSFGDVAAKIGQLDGVSHIDDISSPAENLTAVSVVATAAIDLRPEIFRLAVNNNWVIYEMSREQQTLENIFRELTIGGNHE